MCSGQNYLGLIENRWNLNRVIVRPKKWRQFFGLFSYSLISILVLTNGVEKYMIDTHRDSTSIERKCIMNLRSELSECELATMKCVWDAGEPVTCQQVIERLRTEYGMDYRDTTVYTFLSNLKAKKFITSKRKGLTYYKAIRSEEEYRNEQLAKTEQFWFGGSSSKLVSALLQVKEVSKEEREELKQLIDGLDNE